MVLYKAIDSDNNLSDYYLFKAMMNDFLSGIITNLWQ